MLLASETFQGSADSREPVTKSCVTTLLLRCFYSVLMAEFCSSLYKRSWLMQWYLLRTMWIWSEVVSKVIFAGEMQCYKVAFPMTFPLFSLSLLLLLDQILAENILLNSICF